MHKKILSGMLCGMLLLLCCGCGKGTQDSQKAQDKQTETEAEADGNLNPDFINNLKAQGYLTVGCKMDVPDLSFYDEAEGSWSGLEVELAYQTAANVFEVGVEEAKEQNLVKFVGVTVADREEKLEGGDVDCLLATYTITDERKKRFAFSDSYYTDYIGLMVRTSGDNPNSLGSSDIRSVANLDGKYIGVPRKATTREAFLKYIDMMNTLKVAPIFCEYDGYDGLFAALKKGDIDVMAVDVSILNGYVDKTTTILNDRFGGQHYGAAVKKENAMLLEFINEAIGI